MVQSVFIIFFTETNKGYSCFYRTHLKNEALCTTSLINIDNNFITFTETRFNKAKCKCRTIPLYKRLKVIEENIYIEFNKGPINILIIKSKGILVSSQWNCAFIKAWNCTLWKFGMR